MNNIEDDFKAIEQYAHCQNWLSDWMLVHELYLKNSDTYSVFTPFAYSYLEEAISATTTKYGLHDYSKFRNEYGKKILEVAILENADNAELTEILEKMRPYFNKSSAMDVGNNRNSVMHGFVPPLYWTRESFETLIHDIARISKYSRY